MEKFINEMCDLFGQYGWKNTKEKDRIVFTKKQETCKDTEVTVLIGENHFYIIFSDSKYEEERVNYHEMLHLAEQIYRNEKQVGEWARRYKKKNFFKVVK